MAHQQNSPNPTDPLQQGHPENPLANYQFNHDELRVLRECNLESFYQRSLPLGTILGVGAYLGVKQGHFTANAKYGSIPKVVVGVVIGYFMGKFSYQQKCAEKLMRLPNSHLGEVLRQRQKGGLYSVLTPDKNLGAGMAMAPFTSGASDMYTDEYSRQHSKSSALDLDTERNQLQGLDDTYRPTLDSTPQTFDADLALESPKQAVTYDELRKKNREDYARKAQSPYTNPLPPQTPIVRRSYEKPIDDSTQKNKYGDSWSN